MTPLQRGLLAWFAFVGVFLVIIWVVAMQGNRIVGVVDTISRFERAKALYDEGFDDEAIAEFRDVLRLYPDHEGARTLLVETLVQRGRFQEARTSIEEGLEVGGEAQRFSLTILAARLCLEAADWDAAHDRLNEAFALEPNSAEAHYLSATLAERTGEFATMAQQYAEANALRGQASSEQFTDMLAERRNDVARLELDGSTAEKDAERRYLLAMAYRKAGQWENAVRTLAPLRDAPDLPADGLYWLGVEAEVSGNVAEAAQLYEATLARMPVHRGAARSLDRLRDTP